jgi:hypothetical protein
MGHRGRRIVEEQFDLHASARQLAQLFATSVRGAAPLRAPVPAEAQEGEQPCST